MNPKTKKPQYIKGYWRNADGTKMEVEPEVTVAEVTEAPSKSTIVFYWTFVAFSVFLMLFGVDASAHTAGGIFLGASFGPFVLVRIVWVLQDEITKRRQRPRIQINYGA